MFSLFALVAALAAFIYKKLSHILYFSVLSVLIICLVVSDRIYENNFIFPFIVFLLLVVIISVIVVAHKKLSRTVFWLALSAFTVALIASITVAYNVYQTNFKLSFVPEAFNVKAITYVEEEMAGFGPGGNEVGVITYPLSDEVAAKITKNGLGFLNNLPANTDQKDREWRGEYRVWNETPIKKSYDWKPNEAMRFMLDDYICRYVLCIDIDRDVADLAENIINSKGSYYAYGRIGLIIVSPAKRIVIYMYAG